MEGYMPGVALLRRISLLSEGVRSPGESSSLAYVISGHDSTKNIQGYEMSYPCLGKSPPVISPVHVDVCLYSAFPAPSIDDNA